MMLRRAALISLLVLSSSAYAAEKPDANQMGTPEQRAACGPDVGRHCKHVKPEEGPMAYYSCLQEHREKLRPACVRVLDGGQP